MFNKVRQKFWTSYVKKRSISVGKNLKVNACSKVYKNVVLGDNVNFNGITIKGKGICTIGNNFHSGQDCLIILQNHNYEGTEIPYDSTNIIKNVVIEDNVWIGDRVIILGGITIGEGAIIQAGSVVCKNIPPYVIAGGHPATEFSRRDIQHYERLKKEKKYH